VVRVLSDFSGLGSSVLQRKTKDVSGRLNLEALYKARVMMECERAGVGCAIFNKEE